MSMRTPTYENYGIYPHQQIWDEMHGGAGVSSQGDVMAEWRKLAGRLTDIRRYVESAISGVRVTQQGAGADGAVGTLVPMGAWVDEAQRLVNDTHNRISDQISAFTRARGNVPEVPPEPRGGGWKDAPIIDSFTTSDQEIDEAFNAEQERQARAAMMAYQNDSNERVVSVAEFAPPPAGEPDLSIPTARRSEVGGFPGSSGAGGAAPGAQTSLAGVGAGGSAELPAAPTGPQGGGGPVGPPIGGGPTGPDGGGRPAPAAVPAPVGGGPGVAPRTPAAGGPRGPGSGGRVGAGRGGSGGAGMRGGPGAGGFRPQGGRPGVGGFGPERGGFGPVGSPESAAARAASVGGAGAGRGAANAGGVPFGGAGGGRGGEDNERRRPSYLIEPDSNRLIGELPWTAPAVIGEDLPDDDEPIQR